MSDGGEECRMCDKRIPDGKSYCKGCAVRLSVRKMF